VSATLRRPPGLAGPLAISALLHVLAATPFVLWRTAAPPALPPMYRVDLVAAPTGDPAIGVVRETPQATPPPPEAKAPPKAEMNEQVKAAPIKAPSRAVRPQTRATTNVTKTPEKRVDVSKAPTAGGGEVGSTGTDVATVRTEGIEFPFPGYLANIVRQVRLNFRPRHQGLKAEVFFFIRRDGSVTGFRFVKRSGNYEFDLEAEAAVEAAARSFGPLPAGFTDDILPIAFSFDPATLR
jgi:protein TonB